MDDATNVLNGKVALVTGASSDLGKATVRRLAKKGATVIAVARREKLLNSLVVEIEDNGGKAESMALDLSHFDAVSSAVKVAAQRLGRLDILVTNASVRHLSPLVAARPKDLREMIHVNFIGAVSITQAAAQVMRNQGGGHIINVCTTSGLRKLEGASVYAATRIATGTFFDSLRRELAACGVRVSTIHPCQTGHIPAIDAQPDGQNEPDSQTEASLLQEAEDIADAILYTVTQPERINVDQIRVRTAASWQ